MENPTAGAGNVAQAVRRAAEHADFDQAIATLHRITGNAAVLTRASQLEAVHAQMWPTLQRETRETYLTEYLAGLSESAHTPGPWRNNGPQVTARGDWNAPVCIIVSQADPRPTAGAAARDLATAEANARLIASAPELLVALTVADEGLARLLSTGRFDSKASLGAIARAQYGQALARAAIAKATQ